MAPDPAEPLPRAGLVLDFDGTILDTEEPLYRSWAELWADHGHRLERADWQRNIGGDDLFDPWTELEGRVGRRLDPELQDRRRLRRDEMQVREPLRSGISRLAGRGGCARRARRRGLVLLARLGRRPLGVGSGSGTGSPPWCAGARRSRPSPSPPRTDWHVPGSGPALTARWRWRTPPTAWPPPSAPVCSPWLSPTRSPTIWTCRPPISWWRSLERGVPGRGPGTGDQPPTIVTAGCRALRRSGLGTLLARRLPR